MSQLELEVANSVSTHPDGDALDGALSRQALKLVFERFNQASVVLASKYELLKREAEALRQRLREKDAEIARTARLAMLGETAAAIAHEVRNPLGSIRLFASLLHQDLADRPDSLKLVEEIDKSVSNLEIVVSNILQFAKHQSLQMAPVNLHAVIQEQVADLNSRQSRDLEVKSALAGNPFIKANEQSMRQLLFNLLLNAQQALRYKGEITVSCTDLDADQVLLTVKDNGPGVPEKLRARLFEPFVSGRPEGTGLGLAIVRQIVEQHSGKIEVRNESGAAFSISLPRRPKEKSE
jgi:signal transduction histidine kinase